MTQLALYRQIAFWCTAINNKHFHRSMVSQTKTTLLETDKIFLSPDFYQHQLSLF